MVKELELSRKFVIGEVLARTARQNPTDVAVTFGKILYTYGKLNERVNCLANGLIGLGIKKNDKVALLLSNSTEIIESYFAIAKIGAVCVPLNFRLVENEIEHLLEHSDSKIIIYHDTFEDIINSIKKKSRKIEHYIIVGKSANLGVINYEKIIEYNPAEEPIIIVDEDDVTNIMYTAGTTGLPKGAMLTHKNQLMGAINFLLMFGIKSDDKWLCVPPLFHEAAYICCLTLVFMGGSIVIQNEFSPENILKCIEKDKITTLFLVPAMWNALIQFPDLGNYDTSSLRLGNTGSAPTPEDNIKSITKNFKNIGIYNTFGQTEVSGATTTLKAEDAFRKHGSVGKPGPLVDVRVVDNKGEDVGVNQIGEIVYRGPLVMKGYYKNTEATKASTIQGWFHSGDLVYRDKDGFIYVADRMKDMIISGGENIYSSEVEEVLLTNPKIMEVAIIGVPDKKWGESVKAIVVIRDGETLTEDEVIKYCNGRMAGFKRPRSVVFIDELPRSATGKVLKHKLRKF